METDSETTALCEGVAFRYEVFFCDSKKAAVDQVHVQSNPQMKQDTHTHLLDPGSNLGNSYALGHDNQLDANTLAAFWMCRSCKDGTEDVKQGTQGR